MGLMSVGFVVNPEEIAKESKKMDFLNRLGE